MNNNNKKKQDTKLQVTIRGGISVEWRGCDHINRVTFTTESVQSEHEVWVTSSPLPEDSGGFDGFEAGAHFIFSLKGSFSSSKSIKMCSIPGSRILEQR